MVERTNIDMNYVTTIWIKTKYFHFEQNQYCTEVISPILEDREE